MNSVRRMFRSSALILRSYSSSATTRKRSKSLPARPRPTEIPFQPKVANAVNLIGQVHMPVQFETCADGNTWAATVITRQESHSSPYLFIPVIFEGDLALTAKTHLQQNDVIHIAGQLSTDPPHLDQSSAQTNIQVMVQSLNFVKGYPQEKNISATSKQEKMLTVSVSEKHDINQSAKDVHSKQSEEHDIDKSWKDLLNNPIEWWDERSTKNRKGAAFERKTNGELLFINSSTPKWLQEKLESIAIDLKPEPKHSKTSAKKDPDSSLSPWRDLLDNPKQWSDFRDSKLNRLVNPRHPDFKRKDGSLSLWLNRAPTWVSSELEGLEFDDAVVKSKQVNNCKGPGDQSWNDLVENPTKWLDNRSDKTNERAPDFKHKETGQVLWLNRAPTWVSSKLKGLEFDDVVVKSKQVNNCKGSGDQSWNDLVENPTKWLDNRSDKTNERAPDFKHKETGQVLWLNRAPTWVLSKLKGLEFDVPVVKSKQANNCKGLGDQSWNDLVENPTKWLDNRSDKTNERAPDFKHKETGQVLWLNRAPTWVLSKLKGLEFDVPVVKSKQAKNCKDDQSWNDLVKNPTKWWDNRLNKKNERFPDFKHKESGQALWLNGSPSWVLSKLPPLEPKQSVETGRKQTLVS